MQVQGPRVTTVELRTRCGSMKTDLAAIRPEATPEGASVYRIYVCNEPLFGSVCFAVTGGIPLPQSQGLRRLRVPSWRATGPDPFGPNLLDSPPSSSDR